MQVTLTIDYIAVMGETFGDSGRVYDAAAFETTLQQKYADALGLAVSDIQVTSATPKLSQSGEVSTVETVTNIGPGELTFSVLESAVETMAGSAATNKWSESESSSWSASNSNSWEAHTITPATYFEYTYLQASSTSPMEVSLSLDYASVMGAGSAYDAAAFEEQLAQNYATYLGIAVSEVQIASAVPQYDATGQVGNVQTVANVGPASLTTSALVAGVEAMHRADAPPSSSAAGDMH
jgi:hypothetical protein